MINRVLCKSLMVGLALFFACSAYATENIDKPDIHVGDRWDFQHTNGLANEKDFTQIDDVVEITDDEIRVRSRIKGKPGNGIGTYTREWNAVDVGSARYQPNLNVFAFPLQVGKKWDGNADKMLFTNGKHGKFQLKGEVVAFEKVTVPAGTFDAYKISIAIDAVATDEDANIGHTVETYWYAPSVKRYVKSENVFSRDGRPRSKDIYELLDFSLR